MHHLSVKHHNLIYYKIFCVTVVFKCEARLARPIFLVLLYSIFEPQPIISELKSEIDTGKKLEYIYISLFSDQVIVILPNIHFRHGHE